MVNDAVTGSGGGSTINFNALDPSFTPPTSSSISITRSEVNTYDIVFGYDITVTVSEAEGILYTVLRLPQDLQGQTEGLLGNFNGDASDDFIFQDGTVLSDNAADSEIHNFGQSCKCTC